MSEIKVNKISPRTACGTTTLGDSGDTFTLPSGATITIASGATISNSGTASGFGGTGEISWSTTVKTTGTFTAVAGVGYFLNTTGGIITVNLPAGSAGASVALADYAGTFQTNAVTVSPNGTEKMGGVASDITLSTEGQSVTFVYIDSTQGWVNVLDSTSNVRGNPYIVATGGSITTSGNDKIHTFTGPGTFTVCGAASCAADNIVSYMVVAGGGSGGKGNAGGGGAGGYRELKSPSTPYTASPLDGYPSSPNRVTVAATAYPITIGAGGAIQTSPYSEGNVGSNSIFSTITSAGGGYGGAYQDDGQNGGSGGGGGADCTTGGTGNTPPVTPAQGQNGGNGAAPNCGGAGGGGAGAAGSNPSPTQTGGAGGAGVTTEINASPVQRAGGGGAWGRPGPGGSGGAGGGGAGGNNDSGAAGSGTVNTGSGGGGTGNPAPTTGGGGGSGIVIIRYRYQ